MSVQELPALPSATELLTRAIATSKIRLLPGRFPPPYPIPLHCGVPLAPGKVRGPAAAWLIAADGAVFPAQWDVLSRWPDSSVRWALIETLAEVREDSPRVWTVVFVAETVHQDKGCMTLSGDTAAVKFGLAGSDLIRLDPLEAGFDGDEPEVMRQEWIAQGPLRSTWHVRGRYPRHPSIRLSVRISAFGETGLVKIDVGWQNTRRARHRGGLWDLGDAGSVLFHQAGWQLRLPDASDRRLEYQLEPGKDWIGHSPRLEIRQASSGGEHWDCINHVDRTGKVSLQFQGYRLDHSESAEFGQRATPSVRIVGPDLCVTATICHFWQQFPKSLTAAVDGMEFGLFPPLKESLHELQGGERKTHTIWLKVDPAGVAPTLADLSWVHDPPRLMPVLDDQPLVPGWPRLARLDAIPISRLDALCAEVLDGPNSVFARREQIDEYGWRNFGDFFADHETRYYRGPEPLISHFNNQYDVLGGLLLQGLRTEDCRWFELADNLAWHVTDIDLYHTTEDRAVFNGGMFWLTDHYSSCGTATHRCFSRLNAKPGQAYGGGPGCEHNYSTGLLAHYWLTGSPAAKEAVVQLAEWVLAMDDGRQTIFGLLDDGPTGAATATADENYHGPGRGAGNSINALLDAWHLTGERKYLTYAEELLRRCIHPQDDIAARDLLNFEARWSYTVFLMAVFKYLECKREHNEIDADYEYARQSLLHYAAWMVEQERPYFEREAQMEFPTETWGAQELRKANVFRWAACYADEPLRSRLQAKGDEFAERAWHDLCRFSSRTFIRPFTLAMIQGLWDAALRTTANEVAPRPATAPTWEPPAPFVPQKVRVKQLLKSPRGWWAALAGAANPRRWRPFVGALLRMM